MRLHFDLFSEEDLILDNEGVEAPNLGHAIQEAFASMEEMQASGELDGSTHDWTLLIRDANGTERARLSLAPLSHDQKQKPQKQRPVALGNERLRRPDRS